MKSSRPDGRGHWPRNKRRSPLSARKRARVVAHLKRAIAAHGSIKACARALRRSDRTVRRLLAGEDWPARDTAERILRA